MTHKEIIDAFERCIRISDEGLLDADCDGCPYQTEDWVKHGYAACGEFSDLSVEIPWQLADDMLQLVKERNALVKHLRGDLAIAMEGRGSEDE